MIIKRKKYVLGECTPNVCMESDNLKPTGRVRVIREIIYLIFLIAVENGKTSAYSMVFCKHFSIVLNNNEKQTL